jgi:hypothetical protein
MNLSGELVPSKKAKWKEPRLYFWMIPVFWKHGEAATQERLFLKRMNDF